MYKRFNYPQRLTQSCDTCPNDLTIYFRDKSRPDALKLIRYANVTNWTQPERDLQWFGTLPLAVFVNNWDLGNHPILYGSLDPGCRNAWCKNADMFAVKLAADGKGIEIYALLASRLEAAFKSLRRLLKRPNGTDSGIFSSLKGEIEAAKTTLKLDQSITKKLAQSNIKTTAQFFDLPALVVEVAQTDRSGLLFLAPGEKNTIHTLLLHPHRLDGKGELNWKETFDTITGVGINTEPENSALLVADVDGDGASDLIIASQNADGETHYQLIRADQTRPGYWHPTHHH